MSDDLRAAVRIKRNRSRAGGTPRDRTLNGKRHLVDCFFVKLNWFPCTALRCEKALASCKAFVDLACAMAWIA